MFLRLVMNLGLLAVTSFCFADGLPFNQNKTHILGKVEVLKLTPSQQVEVSRTRILTLTKPQMAKLQKLAKACPNVLQVLTNRYDDCSCGLSSIAVWFRPGEVEVPIGFLPKVPMTKEEMADFGTEGPTAPAVLIDERIQIWVGGKQVSEQGLQKILLRWKSSPAKSHPRNDAGDLFIFIDTPPVMFGARESQLRDLVNRLRSFTTNQKIELFVSGFRAEGQ